MLLAASFFFKKNRNSSGEMVLSWRKLIVMQFKINMDYSLEHEQNLCYFMNLPIVLLISWTGEKWIKNKSFVIEILQRSWLWKIVFWHCMLCHTDSAEGKNVTGKKKYTFFENVSQKSKWYLPHLLYNIP